MSAARLVPDVGTLFDYQGRGYRVDAWLKPSPERPTVEDVMDSAGSFGEVIAAILDESQREIGPDRVRVEFCPREEAVYVSGSGVAGCIARIEEITVTGVVPWGEEHLADVRAHANRLGALRERVW